MARLIVRQPDGLYALYGTIVDDWVYFDCSEEDVVEVLAEEAAERARTDALRIIEDIKAGRNRGRSFEKLDERAYCQHGKRLADIRADGDYDEGEVETV